MLLWCLGLGAWSFTPTASAQQLFIEKSEASTAVIDAMYVKGLRYLAKQQAEDVLHFLGQASK